MKMRFLLSVVLAVCPAGFLFSQNSWFDFRAGVNLGGTSPLPLPAEIREIKGFNPLLLPVVEVGANRSFGSGRWGVRSAVRLEQKGMETEARVKNYGMVITGEDGNSLSGFWTGCVKTHMRTTLLTVPVWALLRPSDRLSIGAGPYVSFLLKGSFDGNVYDGYLREGTPVGDKVSFGPEDSSPYDFSDSLQKLQFGLSLGVDYVTRWNLLLSASFSWGLTGVFPGSFETIRFGMYPIYASLAVGYRLGR